MTPYSRRRFLRQLLGAGAFAAVGMGRGFALETAKPDAFRFAFLTDFHLMKEGAKRSAEGMAACLAAVEKLEPKPEFILVGGDLIHCGRDLTIGEAEKHLEFFLKVWNDHTALPVHWTFGNHDLIGTSNAAVSPQDRHYAKGLFKDRLQLRELFYSFDFRGWHFIVLDDIAPLPGKGYRGELFDDELAFLLTDLETHRHQPTIVCAHIPMLSNLALGVSLKSAPPPTNLVCTNGGKLIEQASTHQVKAVLAGHLHFHEEMQLESVRFINGGAVCGSYWRGPFKDCKEGFGVVDLGTDGSVKFEYRDYGWKAG